MSRVTENSSHAAISYALNKTKTKLEDLQLKGSTLKAISKPSDNPISNVESLRLKSTKSDNGQYAKNIDHAHMTLSTTEQALDQLTEILSKAKEIAIAQSSDIYNADVRGNVSNEVIQLKNQLVSIANRRSGNRYIFSGHKTLTQPFTAEGEYKGDNGIIELEISKEFFIPVNITGREIFLHSKKGSPQNTDQLQQPEKLPSRGLASVNPHKTQNAPTNMFTLLDGLIIGLENNDSDTIKMTLEKFDESLSHVITLRTKVGSLSNTLMASSNQLSKDNIDIDTRNSKLVDADIAELYSDLSRQKSILETTYKASSNLMNKKLLDFLH